MRPSGRQKLQLNSNNIGNRNDKREQIDYDREQKEMNLIKSRQLLSTIMDTIEEKSTNNNEQLKQSMRHFDKQLMNLYSSSKSNSIQNGNRFYQIVNNNERISMSNYAGQQRDMRHTMSYREKRHSSNVRRQEDKYNNNNNQSRYDSIDPNKTIKQSNNLIKGSNYHQNINLPVKNSNCISTRQLIPSSSVYKLQVPKPNSLTDEFMQQVLGSQQTLIEQYERTVNPQKYQQQKRQQKIQSIRKQWMKSYPPQSNQYNNENNMYNNSQNNNNSNSFQLSNTDKNTYIMMVNNYNSNNVINGNQSKAFHDEDYYSYLKTNMKYLAQMNSQMSKPNLNKLNVNQTVNQIYTKQQNSLVNQFNTAIALPQSFVDKHADQQKQKLIILDQKQIPTRNFQFNNDIFPQQQNDIGFLPSDPSKIINKLKETGGIQNTIKKMQKSLKKNQLKHLKQNQYLQPQPNKNNRLTLSSQSPKNLLSSNNRSQLTGNKMLLYNQKTQNNNRAVKSVNNSFMLKHNQQPRKINHNYNQPLYINKNDKEIQINNNNNLQSQARNKSSWRQKSQSMRNKINQSLQKK